jgi:hypothetical protein
MKMLTNWILLFSTIVLVITNQGCAAENKSISIINKPWIASNQLIYMTNGPAISVPALSSSFKVQNSPINYDIKVFTNPKTGSVWADQDLTLFIETDSGIQGALVNIGGEMLWKHSCTKRTKEHESVDQLAARVESLLDQNLQQHYRFEETTDLEEHLSPFFFHVKPEEFSSPTLLDPKLISLDGTLLQLQFDNTWGKHGTVYIDIRSHLINS